MLNPSGFTTGTTIVRVRCTSDVVRVSVPVVAQQVVRELDRVLRRRPLTSVVHAHVQEDGLAVLRVRRVHGDLDPVHVTAQHALVLQRERPDEQRVPHRELLHLEVVVGQTPVAVPAARQRRRRPRAGRSAGPWPVASCPRSQVGDADAVAESGATKGASIATAVQHDLDRVGVAVLGQIEAEPLQTLLVRPAAGDHVDHLDLARACLGDRGEVEPTPSRSRRRRG